MTSKDEASSHWTRLPRPARMTAGAAVGVAIAFAFYIVGAIVAKSPYDPTPIHLYLKWNVFDNLGFAFWATLSVGAFFGAWLTGGRWTVVGTLLYMSLITTVAGFILYSGTVMLPQRFSPLNLVLFLAEATSLTLVCVYAYYTIDRVSRREWRRHYAKMPRSPNAYPKVEFHVPLYNEPPHVVMEVIDHLLRMDYPKDRYRIVVADDSTDEASRQEIESFCHDQGRLVQYVHRTNRRGFKAGALNEVLRHTPEDVELIAVVDADYKVEPNFLKETVGYFEENPELGFLQTPQDFHNVDYSPFTKQIYRAHRFFYDAIMPARNETNSIIFCGTMGIVRRRALEEAGGWGEDVLTEDAETSIRISACGWESLYVPKTYGRGLLPQSFSAYKSQQYRWAFGGLQVLKKHGLKVLFSRWSARQRFDLVAGALHYFTGTILTLIAGILFIFGLGHVLGYDMITYHRGEIWLMGLVPFFILGEGLLRMRWALGKSMKLNMRETMGVLGVWYATSFFTTWAALKAIAGSNEGFVRTPKFRARQVSAPRAWWRAIRLMKFETTAAWCLGVVGLASLFMTVDDTFWILKYGSVVDLFTSLILTFWLLWYAYVFFCGPLYASRGSRGPAAE